MLAAQAVPTAVTLGAGTAVGAVLRGRYRHSRYTTAWLDALEAGATDYCSCRFEKRQIQWMMETRTSGPKVCHRD